MFGFLKDKIKGALEKFSKKIDEAPEEVKEVIIESKDAPRNEKTEEVVVFESKAPKQEIKPTATKQIAEQQKQTTEFRKTIIAEPTVQIPKSETRQLDLKQTEPPKHTIESTKSSRPSLLTPEARAELERKFGSRKPAEKKETTAETKPTDKQKTELKTIKKQKNKLKLRE